MKFKRWLKHFSVKLELQFQYLWLGIFWKTIINVFGFKHLDVWICILPILTIHVHCIIGRTKEKNYER